MTTGSYLLKADMASSRRLLLMLSTDLTLTYRKGESD